MTWPLASQSQTRGYPTATAAVQAQLASAFYSSQALLAAMATRDILGLWQQMNLRDIRSAWPAVRTGIAALIGQRFGMSAAQAVTYYGQARSAAGAAGEAPRFNLPPVPFPSGSIPLPIPLPPSPLSRYSLPPIPYPGTTPAAGPVPPVPTVTVPPPSQELVTATLDSTGPYSLLGRIKQGQPAVQAAQTTGVVMSGAASRLVLNGARQVIIQAVQADGKAVGWMRVLGVTRTGPCAFCAMLATRVDFKSKASALAFWHNHCACTAQPIFSAEDAQALLDHGLYQQWKEVTKGYSKHQAFLAWRRYWDKKTKRDGISVLPPIAA